MNELPATVFILDRPYKLKIDAATEQYLRQAANLIDEQARTYGKMYGHKDRQDLLAMVALTQITKLLQIENKEQYRGEELDGRLAEIEQLLDTAMKEQSCT